MSGSLTTSALLRAYDDKPTEMVNYYRTKIEESELLVREKVLNIRRLEAQRNEWNTKGVISCLSPLMFRPSFSPLYLFEFLLTLRK